jgi:hypothetical protein
MKLRWFITAVQCFIYLTIRNVTAYNTNFVLYLINTSFTKNTKCLCLITDSFNGLDLGEVFENIQIVSIHIHNFKHIKKVWSMCDGYIVLSDDIIIKELFTIKTINKYFKAHKSVLWFVKEPHQLDSVELEASTTLQNLDLTVLTSFVHQVENNLLPKHKFVSLEIHNKSGSKKDKWSPRRNLLKYGEKFRAALFDCSPYVSFNRRDKSYDGLEIKMLNEILTGWPLDFVHFHKDKNFTDDLFAKALQQVVDNKCDIALCAQWFENANKHHVEKSVEYMLSCRNFLVARPELLPNYSFIFQPFYIDLWILYFLTLIFCTIMIHLMSNIFGKISGIEENISKIKNLGEIIIHLLRIFSLGSVNRLPHSQHTSMRFFLIILFLFCILVSVYYSAGLTISLRFPRFSTNLNTVQDVIDNGIKWFDGGGMDWTKLWMESSENSKFNRLASLFESVSSITEVHRKLRGKDHGLLVETCAGNDLSFIMFSEILDEHGRKHMKIIPEDIACFYAIFPLKPNSPYVNLFNRAIHNFIEYGFIKHWLTEFANKPEYRYMKQFFQRYSQEIRQDINLKNVQGAFHFLMFGYSLACLIFCMEKVVKKYTGVPQNV